MDTKLARLEEIKKVLKDYPEPRLLFEKNEPYFEWRLTVPHTEDMKCVGIIMEDDGKMIAILKTLMIFPIQDSHKVNIVYNTTKSLVIFESELPNRSFSLLDYFLRKFTT